MEVDLDAVRVFFRMAPFMVDLGVEPTAVAPGRMTTTLQLAPRHLQHMGQVHAGVMAAMADHTMGAAAQTLARPGQWIVTAELKTSCLRAARGERLVCEAQVLKAGGQISFTEAEVYVMNPAETPAENRDKTAANPAARRTLVFKASATMAVIAKA